MATTGAELIAESLAARNVDRVYGLHGGHVQLLFDVLPEYGIDIVTTRDERAAAYMAHAHYQVTGKTGVALITAGPGVTNALTGIANANITQVPLVMLGGSASVKQFERLALQEMDQESVFEPVTNWTRTVFEAERIPEYVDAAFRKAERPRPGPSFLNLPMDVLNEDLPEEYLDNDVVRIYDPPAVENRQHPDPDAVDRVASTLQRAEQPVAISGIGVLNADAGAELRSFVETARIPHLDTAESRGFVPGSHPLNVNAARSKAVGEADAIVLVGKRMDFGVAYGSDVFFNPAAEIVQIDADPSEIGRNRPVDVPLVADEAAALRAVTDRLESADLADRDDWISELSTKDEQSRRKLEERMMEHDETPVHPWRLCGEIKRRLEDDAYVACDGGDILSFGRIALDVEKGRHWFSPGPFGCLGATIGFSNAAAILRPDHQVVCLIGDGSFGFNAMELDTAVRHDADVTFVVANNAAWNIERFDQKEVYDNVVGTALEETRYDRIAEAVDAHGEHVETPSELGPALDRAFEHDGPSLVNVVVERDVASPDHRQGMRSRSEDEGLPDLQILLQWDDRERERRGILDDDDD